MTNRKVDELVNGYHSQLSKSEALSIGAAYARSSTSNSESIVDQLRRIFERAIELRVYVPREFVLFDIRATGRKERFSRLIDLENLLRDNKVQTLMLFETNRLFRSTFRSLEFADRVHKDWGIRVVFVSQGVDTNFTKEWEQLIATHAMIDQFCPTRRRRNHSPRS